MQQKKQLMKYLQRYWLAVLALLSIVSCTSDQDTNGDLLHNIWYDFNTKQLQKIETHLKDDTSGVIETESYSYNYDGFKLVSYTDQDGNLTVFEYNTDNKIAKMTGDGEVSVWEYSGGNVSKITTTLQDMGTISSTYTYTGGKLSKVESVHDYTLPFPVKSYIATVYDYAGANVSKSIISSGIYNASGTLVMSPEVQTISYTYDNKKSPYLLLPKEYILLLSGLGPQGGAYLSVNNFVKVSISDGTSTKDMEFSHDYDKDGYPLKSTANDQYIKYTY